ncbi:MAG TPA: glycosyltransferase family 4 protein [Anaerolineales bacterium]|nr:glycosyltransferase family 4 protein [Anaerolineales bacterium]
MRVLYFSESYGPHDHRFLTFLAGSGWSVSYLRRRGGPVLERRPLPDGVSVLPPLDPDPARPRRLGIALLEPLRQALEQSRPDVVHAGPIPACAYLVASARFPRLVGMSWGSDLLDDASFGLARWQAIRALRATSVFLGDCEAVRRRAVDLGMDERRTVIFPWGVDLETFRPGPPAFARQRLGWEERTVFLCLRSWETRYGVDTVVEAFLRAARRDADLRLILAGDGSLRPGLIERIESSGLADRFWIPGYVAYSELPMLYHSADVYVSGAHSDGSSVSLLEAMACGLPCLVTDIPGNREWVEAGRSGLWFQPGDVAGLANRMIEAAGLRSTWAALGSRGRDITESRADWRRNAPRMIEAYQRALSGPEVAA